MPALAGSGDAAIGVDLGGTKIAAVLVDEDGAVLEHAVVPTAAARGPDSVLADIVQLAEALKQGARARSLAVRGLGVASAGVVDHAAGVLVSVTDSLPGFAGCNLRDRLEEATQLSVGVLNDVQGMALGEQRLGAGRLSPSALYIAVGTGIGGALTRGGELDFGAHGSAGDIGHVLIDAAPTARRCPCGRLGHLEAYASGPAISALYDERIGQHPGTGDLRSVVRDAAGGDEVGRAVLAEGATLLGRAIGGISNALDPEIVVFGGGLAGIAFSLFWSVVFQALRDERRSPSHPRLALASLGRNAAAIGAAMRSFPAPRDAV